MAASGTQLSAAQTQWDAPHRSDALLIGLDWPVVAINRRINARVKLMAQAGLLDEVAALAPSLGRTAAEALGYKQLLPVVTGAATLDEALEQVKIRTRRFAKQQRTWLRRLGTIKPACWLKPAEISTEVLAEQALAWVLGQAGH